MDAWLEGLEPAVEHQDLKVPYRYSMGATASKFFIEIRDNKKIMGIKCPKCNMVYVPPRSTCGKCFSSLDHWVELGGEGVLETYTRVHYSTPVQPVSAPFFYGIIKLDGADTGFPHFIGEAGEGPHIGMRLQPVFKEERTGNMLDILYFKPAGVRARRKAQRNGEKPKATTVRGERAKGGRGEKGKAKPLRPR